MIRLPDTLSDPVRNLEESGRSDKLEILPEPPLINIHEESTIAPPMIPSGSLNPYTSGFPIDEKNNSLTRQPSLPPPPPHIAARFYRPSNNRRKSSAASSRASSRRNSISSAQSHQSHQSHASSRHAAGPQSSYVAQHLRRAEILEDRKNRLADRAAHAEKVRLRAALAKAAPRSTTNSEERALAAQQAREKVLEEIGARCAAEVKRAKGVALSMKEKREAEGKQMRKLMEEKLAEAERRREDSLNRGGNTRKDRARSLSQPRKIASPMPKISETISEATAASRIQQNWRIHRRWKALKDFSDLGLTIDGVRDTSFEEVVDLLAQERVLMSTAHILRVCGLKEGESGSVNEMTAIRTFLSAFLILGHPTQVLSSKGDSKEQEQVGVLPLRRDDLANPQLQDLVAKARDLLISFETVLSRLTSANNYTPPPAQLSSLSEVYATFYNAFIAWKARDSSTLIDMMVMQFVELDSIWQTVKDSTEKAVTQSYRDGIRENQLKLMVRIKKLAGPIQGKKLITTAIREARKAQAAKKPVGDSRPRAAESISSPAPTLKEIEVSEKSVTSQLQTLTPPTTPSKDQQQPKHSDADVLRMATTILPDNRTIAHEVAVNREYRIGEEALDQRTSFMETVFHSMRQDLARGNSAPWVLAMAENIKGRLQLLLTDGKAMHTLIGEALDTDVVARELKSGAFSYDKFFSFMGTIIPKLCAPFRDIEMKDLVENKMTSGDVVDRLRALLDATDLMQLDYANYMLQGAVPDLIKHATTYETSRFSEIMEKTSTNLSATETAWRGARTKVLTEAARRDPDNIQQSRNQTMPENVYAQMLTDTFTSLDATTPIPETLEIDSKRITRIRVDILRIVTAGAILLQCKNMLKRDVRSQWKTEATRIYSVLENAKDATSASQGIQAALESSRSMPVATKNHIFDLVTRIVSSSAAISVLPPFEGSQQPLSPELRDPVLRLLMTRLRGHIFNRLAANTEKEKVKTASTASESLATLGLPEFVSKVGSIVEEISRVGALDREAHGVWYELIARKVEEADVATA